MYVNVNHILSGNLYHEFHCCVYLMLREWKEPLCHWMCCYNSSRHHLIHLHEIVHVKSWTSLFVLKQLTILLNTYYSLWILHEMTKTIVLLYSTNTRTLIVWELLFFAIWKFGDEKLFACFQKKHSIWNRFDLIGTPIGIQISVLHWTNSFQTFHAYDSISYSFRLTKAFWKSCTIPCQSNGVKFNTWILVTMQPI